MIHVIYGFNLTKGQADKLQRATKNVCLVSIRLAHTNLKGDHRTLPTFRQFQKITKLLLWSCICGRHLEMSVVHEEKGCFLPLFASLASTALRILAKTMFLGVGALSSLGSAIVSKAMGSGLYLKRGDSVFTVKPSGTGLYLKPSAGPIRNYTLFHILNVNKILLGCF